ncbi:MAG: hypothetical protein JJV89_02015 [Desulfosarcina sp.]|nr:hypothetical protein [Desulfobacterales bacterium]
MLKQLTGAQSLPMQGGAVTVRNAAQLPFGAFSGLENLRNRHPGMVLRNGMHRMHFNAIGSDPPDRIISLFQFKKTNIDEDHFYAQTNTGDILESIYQLPTISPADFGQNVFAGTANQQPASWAVFIDMLLMANGIDQHQIYAGDSSYIEKFILYKDYETFPDIPIKGYDISLSVRNTRVEDLADISNLEAYNTPPALYGCLLIRTPVPVRGFTITMSSADVNTNNSAMSVYYHSGTTNSFAEVDNLIDGTSNTSFTFGKSGQIVFDETTDIQPRYMYGSNGFWYQIRLTQQLDPSVKIKTITYLTEFQDIINVWDGIYEDIVEVRVPGVGNEYTYAGSSVDISEMLAGAWVSFASATKLEGLYIDCGATPNDTGNTIVDIRYWNGYSFASVGLIDDSTNGLANSGLIKFDRTVDAEASQYKTSLYQAYWYRFQLSADASEDVVFSMRGMPFFDIEELGKSACNCVWKDRAIYSFDEYGAYLYVSAAGKPMVLNGNDYGILKAGDGRSNKIVVMHRFHNELMVWQEEKGVDGGCVTLFEGYSPETFGKLLLSTKIGSMNSQSVAVVEGVLTATVTDETIKTLVFFLSKTGVCVTDGRTISLVSDDIQNYFDTKKDECINFNYCHKMWLAYDSIDNVLRLGLVSGELGSEVNVFPVLDLVTKTWGFDTFEYAPTCFIEASTDYSFVQLSGGTAGYIYRMNYGDEDIDTAIDGNVRIEFNYQGNVLQMRECLIRFEAQERGDVILEFFKNNVACLHKTISMMADRPSQLVKRSRFPTNIMNQNISVKISVAGHNVKMNLIEFGAMINIWERR